MSDLSDAGLVEKDIDGQTYAFQKLGAEKATLIFFKLVKMVGGSIAGAISAVKGEGSLAEKSIDMDLLGKSISALADSLDEDEALRVVKDLTSGPAVLCDGKKVEYNKHYEGRIDHMFKVLAAALEVQYGNFYAAAAAMGIRRKPSLPSQAQPTTPERPTSPIRNG